MKKSAPVSQTEALLVSKILWCGFSITPCVVYSTTQGALRQVPLLDKGTIFRQTECPDEEV